MKPNHQLTFVTLPPTVQVTALDVVYALKRQGKTLYGFGH